MADPTAFPLAEMDDGPAAPDDSQTDTHIVAVARCWEILRGQTDGRSRFVLSHAVAENGKRSVPAGRYRDTVLSVDCVYTYPGGASNALEKKVIGLINGALNIPPPPSSLAVPLLCLSHWSECSRRRRKGRGGRRKEAFASLIPPVHTVAQFF